MAVDYEVRYNGQGWGGLDGSNPITILELRGIADLPDLRFTSLPRGEGDGTYEAGEFVNGRTIGMRLAVRGTARTGTAINAALEQLAAALTPNTTRTLVFRLPGYANDRFVNARVRRKSVNWRWHGVGYAEVDVEFFCPDPRIFSGALNNTTTPLTVVVPYSGGLTTVANTGNYPATFIADFEFGVNPKLISDAASQAIEISGTVPSPRFVRVRTYERTANDDLNVNYYSRLTTFSLLQIPAGGASFRAVSTLSGVGVTLSYFTTWIS